jgi:hypothetical protein
MMRVWHAAAGVAVTLLLLPASGSAQSLGEAAAKEKDKRKGKTAKVYTETDLRRAGSPGTLSMGGEPADAGAGQEGTPAADGQAPPATDATGAAPGGEGQAAKPANQKSEEQVKAEAQDAWRKKLEKAQTDASTLREHIAKIQSDLNDTSISFYGSRRATMVGLLEQNKQKLAAKEQEITQLEDEGRRSNFR